MLHHFLQRNSICNGRGRSESHLICGLRHGASGLSLFHIVQKLLTQIHGMHLVTLFEHFDAHQFIIWPLFACMTSLVLQVTYKCTKCRYLFTFFLFMFSIECSQASLQASLKLQTRNSTGTMERDELHARDPANKQYLD